MSSPREKPDQHGSLSPENAPRVIVRAGKTFVCSSCGTLVEIPADVVGQLAWVGQHVLPQEPVSEQPVQQPKAQQEPRRDHPTTPQRPERQASRQRATTTATANPRPLGPKRPRQPQRATFVGKLIDGLTVPSGHQLDHALNWVYFHLKVLDRQTEEIKRLKKLLKRQSTQQASSSRPRGDSSSKPSHEPIRPGKQAEPTRAHEDLGVAPNRDNETERGPP